MSPVLIHYIFDSFVPGPAPETCTGFWSMKSLCSSRDFMSYIKNYMWSKLTQNHIDLPGMISLKHLGPWRCHRFGQSNNCCVYILHLYYRRKDLLFTPKEALLLQASACSPHPFPLSFSCRWMCTDALKLNCEEIKDLSRQVKRKSVFRQGFICRPTSGVSTFSRNNKRDTNNWKLNRKMRGNEVGFGVVLCLRHVKNINLC